MAFSHGISLYFSIWTNVSVFFVCKIIHVSLLGTHFVGRADYKWESVLAYEYVAEVLAEENFVHTQMV